MSAVLHPHPAAPTARPVTGPTTGASASHPASTTDTAEAVQAAVRVERDDWCALVAQIGAEVAEPLTSALERIATMAAFGQIDTGGLRALHLEIDRARRAGMLCQQLARLAGGRVRQSHERVHLTHTLQAVLAHRSREMRALGTQLVQHLNPVEVIVDASLLYALLDTTLDWAMAHARGPIDIRIDLEGWPLQGWLQCSVPWRPADEAGTDAPPPASMDNLLWRLLVATGQALGLQIDRQVDGGHARLSIGFPRTVHALADLDPDSAETPGDSAFPTSVNSKPLAGSRVLLIASRRDTRLQVREAVRDMGITLDFVASVDEARTFCEDGLPHAILVDSAHTGARFDAFIASIRRELPQFVFIEIGEDGSEVSISTLDGQGQARVGRAALASSLSSALIYELTRNL